jgi:hypothetical protein
MCKDENVRIVIKQGSGVPTVPVSADHRNGDWIATDIYEGEQYQDTDTGAVYTRSSTGIEAVGGGAGVVKVWRGLITQVGTGNPTAIVLENTLGGTVTFTYVSTGIFTATLTGAFTVDKTFLTFNSIIAGSFLFSCERKDSDDLNLRSLTTSFVSTNGLLNKTELQIIVYP